MIGIKIYKYDMTNYFEVAEWCNNNKATIEDKGDYFEVVSLEPDLQELRDAKKTQMKVERDHREVLPITYKDKIFDYDDKARERMRIAQQALEDNNIPSQTWTCADNTITELTIEDFKAINTLAAQRSGELHIQYNKLKVYIDTLETIEDVQAVTFDTEVTI